MTAPARRISTPLVLALASAMLSIGALGWLAPCSNTERETSERAASPTAHIDMSTPERAAESFIDAWRRRDHEGARSCTAGAARNRVEERAAKDEALTAEEIELKRQIWDLLARERLDLVIRESETQGASLVLRGTMEGEFAGKQYVREVSVETSPRDGNHVVIDFEFGEVTSEAPFPTELD